MGLPKTGTTSIQSWLVSNAGALAARGIGYDRMALPGKERGLAQVELGVCQFAEAGQPHPHATTSRFYGLSSLEAQQAVADQYLKLFQTRIARHNHNTWLFSCEDLGSATTKPDLAQALDRWLKRTFDDVHYIVYLRRQEDWILSRYSQRLRQGETRTLAEFADETRTHSFLKLPDALRNGLGSDRFSLQLFEPDALTDGDLIADFAGKCGIDPAGLTVPERKNEALGVAAAEFLRQANIRWPVTDDRYQRPTQLMGNLPHRLTVLSADQRKLRLSQRRIDAIRDANAASNETLRKRYFPDRAELFPARPQESDDPLQNTPTAAEMAEIGLDVFTDARTGALEHQGPAALSALADIVRRHEVLARPARKMRRLFAQRSGQQ